MVSSKVVNWDFFWQCTGDCGQVVKEKALVTDEPYPLFETLIQIHISSSSFLRSRESLEEVLGNGVTTP